MTNTTPLTSKEQEKFTVLRSLLDGKMTNAQAATILSLSLRQVKRLKKRIREEGASGVIHQLKGKGGNHHLDQSIKETALGLVKEKYLDFKPTFASEKLAEDQGVSINALTLRLWMIEEGVWKAKKHKKGSLSCLETEKGLFWRTSAV